MPSETWSNITDCFHEPGYMGRGMLETAFSLPGRALRRSRLEDMSGEEKDFAHLSSEVYKEPDKRSANIFQYTLLQDEIPGREDNGSTAVPFNDKRWAVFRASNEVDHVFAFRGTADWEDVRHDADLILGFGEHTYMMDAACWCLVVMLFLNGQQNNDGLRFSVTGHSLGGAVAMGVMIMLHDLPATALQLEGSKFQQQEVLDVYNAVISKRGTTTLYDLVGGHIFNPGAIPAIPRETDGPGETGGMVAGTLGALALSSMGVVGIVAGAAVSVGLFRVAVAAIRHNNSQRSGTGTDGVDKRVTTHHILGDLVSCSFRMGTEKSYMPKDKRARRLTALSPGKPFKEWGPHGMDNFL